jgi:hypothetical protein
VAFQVYKETFFDIESTYGEFMPIQLTEEWLSKFGFKRCGYDLLFWRHDNIKGFLLAGINWADADEPNYQFLNYGIGDEIFSIHYIHQLQNLYFGLTGIELILI